MSLQNDLLGRMCFRLNVGFEIKKMKDVYLIWLWNMIKVLVYYSYEISIYLNRMYDAH